MQAGRQAGRPPPLKAREISSDANIFSPSLPSQFLYSFLYYSLLLFFFFFPPRGQRNERLGKREGEEGQVTSNGFHTNEDAATIIHATPYYNLSPPLSLSLSIYIYIFSCRLKQQERQRDHGYNKEEKKGKRGVVNIGFYTGSLCCRPNLIQLESVCAMRLARGLIGNASCLSHRVQTRSRMSSSEPSAVIGRLSRFIRDRHDFPQGIYPSADIHPSNDKFVYSD